MGAGGKARLIQEKRSFNYANLFLRGGITKTENSTEEKRTCAGITKAGKPCRNRILVEADSPFCCRGHAKRSGKDWKTGKQRKRKSRKRYHRCLGTTKAGVQCKHDVRRGDYCPQHKKQANGNNTPISGSAKALREVLSSRVVESVEILPKKRNRNTYKRYLEGVHWAKSAP